MLSEDRRRETRIRLKVPVVVEGQDHRNEYFREETETENVSATGACIRIGRWVSKGSRLTVSAVKFPFRTTAQVELVWVDELDGVMKMGVRFLDPG